MDMSFVCKKCLKRTKKKINDFCPKCWKDGPAIEMMKWLNYMHGFDFVIPTKTKDNH